MLRILVTYVFLASPALAEVCDRSTFPLKDAEEGGPVQEARINFTFESGKVVYPDGGLETVYCVRNDESAPIWVKWHGPKPNILFEDLTMSGGKTSAHASKRFEKTTSDTRKLEYGFSKNYGKETEGKTVTFETSVDVERPIFVQASPLDIIGQPLPDVLANADTLNKYLSEYRNAPGGGNELVIWSYAVNWLPADANVLSQLVKGQEVNGYDGPSFQVTYGLRSVIDIDRQTVTSSVRFYFGNFRENLEYLALAEANGLRGRLSLVTSPEEFPGLADFKALGSYSLAEAKGSYEHSVAEAKVGGDATLKTIPWTVGLAFDDVTLSATQADLFVN